jgi:predicted RNA-binding protein YlqC (UPF0109 family)
LEKDLIEYIAKSLADDPKSVFVNVVEGDTATIVELQMAEADIGKVIGRQGSTARAMRTVLQAAAAKNGGRASLEILS